MALADASRLSDAAELQNVLTRYADSCHGYLEATGAVASPCLAEAFVEIASHRREIVGRIASMIRADGENPEHSALIKEMANELASSLQTFESAIERC